MTRKAFLKSREVISIDNNRVLREVFTRNAEFEVQGFGDAQSEEFTVHSEEGSNDAGIAVQGYWSIIHFLNERKKKERGERERKKRVGKEKERKREKRGREEERKGESKRV